MVDNTNLDEAFVAAAEDLDWWVAVPGGVGEQVADDAVEVIGVDHDGEGVVDLDGRGAAGGMDRAAGRRRDRDRFGSDRDAAELDLGKSEQVRDET